MSIEEVDGWAKIIVDSAYQIHRRIGPGLLESAYKAMLAADLRRRGLQVQREKPFSFDYNGMLIRNAYKADLFWCSSDSQRDQAFPMLAELPASVLLSPELAYHASVRNGAAGHPATLKSVALGLFDHA